MLRRSREREEWARREGLEVAPTLVPQLFVELHAEPNKTVWTGFFQRLLHAAPDAPLTERPKGYEVSRSAGEVFALQARGSKAYNGVQFRIWGKKENDGVCCEWSVEEITRGLKTSETHTRSSVE